MNLMNLMDLYQCGSDPELPNRTKQINNKAKAIDALERLAELYIDAACDKFFNDRTAAIQCMYEARLISEQIQKIANLND